MGYPSPSFALSQHRKSTATYADLEALPLAPLRLRAQALGPAAARAAAAVIERLRIAERIIATAV